MGTRLGLKLEKLSWSLSKGDFPVKPIYDEVRKASRNQHASYGSCSEIAIRSRPAWPRIERSWPKAGRWPETLTASVLDKRQFRPWRPHFSIGLNLIADHTSSAGRDHRVAPCQP